MEQGAEAESRPTPVRQRAEEYDPETGEMRPVAGGKAAPPGAGQASAAGAPVTTPRREDDIGRIGRITVHPAGYGFVATPDGTVFVPAKYRGTSLDGDEVALDTWPGVRGTEGRVVEVLARGRARLTGILRKVGRAVYLEPDDPRIAADYGRVGIDSAPLGKDGDAVVIEITRYPDAVHRELAGKVLKVLGDPEDPRTEIEKILACAVIPLEFPDDVRRAGARRRRSELRPSDLADRIDLRDRRFATIDPETARDFDDALCIEDGPHGGPRVWVAVADVSHYVRWSDALDREAAIRGVIGVPAGSRDPDAAAPAVGGDLLAQPPGRSLRDGRAARLQRRGGVVDVGYAAAVIKLQGPARLPRRRGGARRRLPRRSARCTGRGSTSSTRMHELAQKLRTKRQARGALDLDIAEPKVILDADDPRLVRDVVKAKGDPAVKQAYQLVEEFMIAANEAVGAFFRKRERADGVARARAAEAGARRPARRAARRRTASRSTSSDATTPLGMKDVLDRDRRRSRARRRCRSCCCAR